MALEAPYRGRDNTPAPADKVEAVEADKPEKAGRDEDSAITATRHDAPQADAQTEEVAAEEEVAVEQPEVPDAASVLRHADYTRKTQALARDREVFAAEMAEREARVKVYEQVDAMLASNPELSRTHTVEQLVALIQSPTSPAMPTSLPPEIKREISEFRAERQELKEELFADKVQAAMGRLQAEYGLDQKQVEAVVKIAVENEELNYSTPPGRIHFKLDLIANKLASATAVANGQKKVVQQLKEKGRAASQGNAASSTSAETAGPRVKGWDNLVAKFQAEAKARRSG